MQSNMTRKLIYFILAMLAVAACQDNYEEVLLVREDISLTVKDEVMMSFNENTCQLGYSSASNEYRVYDEKLSNWYIISCSEQPTTEGQSIKANLQYTTDKDVKTFTGLTFNVVKTSSEGLIWMWNKDKRIGIIIKNL